MQCRRARATTSSSRTQNTREPTSNSCASPNPGLEPRKQRRKPAQARNPGPDVEPDSPPIIHGASLLRMLPRSTADGLRKVLGAATVGTSLAGVPWELRAGRAVERGDRGVAELATGVHGVTRERQRGGFAEWRVPGFGPGLPTRHRPQIPAGTTPSADPATRAYDKPSPTNSPPANSAAAASSHAQNRTRPHRPRTGRTAGARPIRPIRSRTPRPRTRSEPKPCYWQGSDPASRTY
jgi:hypothetical protein